MSKLYIAHFTDNGTDRYGLFYDSPDGVRHEHMENWRHVAFDSMEEALAKLEMIEQERRREDNAVAFGREEAALFAEGHRWKFATTYAKTAPHEYLVKAWLPEAEQLQYERFVQTMKRDSVVGFFYGHKNDYLILGDHYYWFMGQHENMAVDLINRTTTDHLEYRDGAYYYKAKPSDDARD